MDKAQSPEKTSQLSKRGPILDLDATGPGDSSVP